MNPWESNLKKLQQYRKRHGHTNVRRGWKSDPTLARWVENMRASNRRLPTALRKELVKLDFNFEPVDDQWEVMYAKLTDYYKKHGHIYVRNEGKQEALARWVQDQRYSKSRLPEEKIKKLDELEFDWTLKSKKMQRWELMHQELKAFKEKYGHTKVLETDTAHRKLSTWVHNLRARAHLLTPVQKKKLNALGFLWQKDLKKLKEGRWTLRYEQLKKFKKQYGHCNVPIKWKENKQLSTWVSQQRLGQEHKGLPPERKKLLDELGFSWSADLVKQFDEEWNEMFKKLKAFRATRGHFYVPATGSDRDLRYWILNQRVMFRGGYLTQERQRKLESIGLMLSKIRELQWEKKFNQLKEFKKKYGTLDVPRKNVGIYKGLAGWKSLQKVNRAKGILSVERIKKLDTLSFDWTMVSSEDLWTMHYDALISFKKKFKHLRVPETPEYRSLAKWMRRQKEYYRKGNLTKHRYKMLTEAGLNLMPNVHGALWAQRFQELCAFQKKFNHHLVPATSVEYEPLARWLGKQRESYREGTLSKDRYDKLNRIGFDWRPAVGRRKSKPSSDG